MLGLSRLSYWVLPVIGGVFWLATLMALLLYWVFSTNRMHYPSMGEAQTLAYISDVGAYNLKPLFITGSVLTTIFFDLAFAADRWLRHRGRLVPNHTTMEKVLSGLTIFFAVVGTVGLILLSIFDTASHPMLHNLFLGFFIGGYMFSAVFICWEYQRLGVQHREHSILATSFWVKLAFIIVEVALAIVFGVTTRSKNFNVAAAVEWTIAFIFVFYVWSFVIDLYPAVRTRRGPGFGGHSKGMAVPVEAEQEMGERSSGSQSSGMPAAHNHHQQYRSAQQNF